MHAMNFSCTNTSCATGGSKLNSIQKAAHVFGGQKKAQGVSLRLERSGACVLLTCLRMESQGMIHRFVITLVLFLSPYAGKGR